MGNNEKGFFDDSDVIWFQFPGAALSEAEKMKEGKEKNERRKERMIESTKEKSEVTVSAEFKNLNKHGRIHGIRCA